MEDVPIHNSIDIKGLAFEEYKLGTVQQGYVSYALLFHRMQQLQNLH